MAPRQVKSQRARAPAAASSTERGRSTTVKSLGQSPARSVARASEPSKPLTRKAMKTASIEPPAKRANADDAVTVATLKPGKKSKKVVNKQKSESSESTCSASGSASASSSGSSLSSSARHRQIAKANKDDGSAVEVSSSSESDGKRLPKCTICFKSIKIGDRRFKTNRMHFKCGKVDRSAMHAVTKNNPTLGRELIRMKKNGDEGLMTLLRDIAGKQKGSSSGISVDALDRGKLCKLVEKSLSRTKAVKKSEGLLQLNRQEFVYHQKQHLGWKKSRSRTYFDADLAKHLEGHKTECYWDRHPRTSLWCIGVERPRTIDFDDIVSHTKKKRGVSGNSRADFEGLGMEDSTVVPTLGKASAMGKQMARIMDVGVKTPDADHEDSPDSSDSGDEDDDSDERGSVDYGSDARPPSGSLSSNRGG